MNSNTEVKKVKASEKLAFLESDLTSTKELLSKVARRTGELEMIIFNLSREKDVLNDALQLMHSKTNSIVALLKEGKALTDENIEEKVVEIRENDLKNKITELVENGYAEPSDETSEKSLIVARELNKDGGVENPRIQFLVSTLIEDLKEKFLGKKVGDFISNGEDKLDMEILEIYNIVDKNEEPAATEESEVKKD